MIIKPVAADSLGTRSMATFVQTKDITISIDPSTRLAPRRFGKPPHRLEKERAREHWADIKKHVGKSKVLILTHYHFDHHNPDAPSIYRGKIVFLKDPTERINRNQRMRAREFIRKIEKYAKEIHNADGETFRFGETFIAFSKPVQHGTTSRMGWVIEVAISRGNETFVYTSDIQGASERAQLSFILNSNPNILLMDGPFSVLMMMNKGRPLKRSENNIIRIMDETKVRDFLIDHHFLRELNYKERIPRAFKAAEERKVRFTTSARFLGLKEDLLEARRNELYRADERAES